jgi:beta-lactam-binding protein with PASTA domain
MLDSSEMVTSQSPSQTKQEGIAWTVSRRLGMVVILILAFAVSAIVTIYALFRAGDTRVPNLIGKTEVEAQRIAEQAKLRVKILRREDDAVAGTVIETRPGPNSSVKKDSSLTIYVSTGAPQKKSEVSKQPGVLLIRRSA